MTSYIICYLLSAFNIFHSKSEFSINMRTFPDGQSLSSVKGTHTIIAQTFQV